MSVQAVLRGLHVVPRIEVVLATLTKLTPIIYYIKNITTKKLQIFECKPELKIPHISQNALSSEVCLPLI